MIKLSIDRDRIWFRFYRWGFMILDETKNYPLYSTRVNPTGFKIGNWRFKTLSE